MKKVLFTLIGIALVALTFGQGTISFYTNNGTKQVTKIKCGEFDNIKVKLNVPQSVKNYDRVSLRIFLSSIESYASILYDGRGATAQLATTKTLEKWVLKPGKKLGDFSFGDGNLGAKDLCEYPREKAIPNVEVTAQLVGMNKAGSEKYWDDFHKKFKIRVKYTKGNLIAQGKMNIEQLPAKVGYVSANGVMSIQKVSANPADEFIRGEKQKSSTSSFLKQLNSTSSGPKTFVAQQVGRAGTVNFTVLFYTDKQIADKVNQLFGKVPSDLDPYEELKRDLLQQLAYGSNNRIYRAPFFVWKTDLGDIGKLFCPGLQDENKKFKKTNTNFFTNMNLWKKEKVGNYEYDVLRVPDTYGNSSIYHYDLNKRKWNSQKSANDIPSELVVYAIKRGEYNVFIFPFTSDRDNLYLLDSKKSQAQKDFIQKTMESIKFLK